MTPHALPAQSMATPMKSRSQTALLEYVLLALVVAILLVIFFYQ